MFSPKLMLGGLTSLNSTPFSITTIGGDQDTSGGVREARGVCGDERKVHGVRAGEDERDVHADEDERDEREVRADEDEREVRADEDERDEREDERDECEDECDECEDECDEHEVRALEVGEEGGGGGVVVVYRSVASRVLSLRRRATSMGE